MMDATKSLPEDPAELRAFTALLLAEVKSQAVLIQKLQHQLAGHRAHRFGVSSETSDQLQLALESEPLRHHWFKPNGERDRHRRADGQAAPAGGCARRQTQAQADPGPYSAHRDRADAR